MSASLTLYRVGTRLLEPVAPMLLRGRLRRGKERADRLPERLGIARLPRPMGALVWMHGASVGECRLLLDILQGLRQQRADLAAVVTSQTLTAADLIGAHGDARLVHQMAPVDAPGPVRRFLEHWRPDAAVFAEGEIWPNMLSAIQAHGTPAALVNARMTRRTLDGWRSRRHAARSLFRAFAFIGAADKATGSGLEDLLGRKVAVAGNLKQAIRIKAPDALAVAAWRKAAGARPVLLAASTHPGEEELALDAFLAVRAKRPQALLILAPRHPDRGPGIAELVTGRGLRPHLRSRNPGFPPMDSDVLVADTIGELLFWIAVSDGIYLGGANAPGVGGHNAIEPAQLGKRTITGPHGFNFREIFERLAAAGALVFADDAAAIAAFWTRCLDEPDFGLASGPGIEALLEEARAPLDATLSAIGAMLPQPAMASRPLADA